MQLLTSLKRATVALVSLGLLTAQVVIPAQAAMVGTEQAVAGERQELARADLLSMLEREDVAKQMEAMGVNADDAKARVAAMTDAQVAELNDRLAELPAGGDALGVILIILLVFIITDIIGATDIFPFIHSINN